METAFLFDLDGTLVDSVYQHVLAWREALETEGIDLAVQMTAASTSSARGIKPQDVAEPTLVPELEKEGRCNF